MLAWGHPESSPDLFPVRDRVAPDEDELRAAYDAYRGRQSRRLVSLLPREAIRPLYRAALEGAPEGLDPGDDPLGLLAGYCEALLPLPPFEVWARDVVRHPDAYLAELAEAADAPGPSAPATLEARRLPREGREWIARLRGFRDDDGWRGFILFEDESSGAVHRTTLIFREGDPRELRQRFLSFERSTLEAFLRSSLP